MNIIDISQYNIIHGVPRVMLPSDRCSIDTEFSGMDKKKLHRPTGIFACATFYAGGKDVWIVEDVRDLAEAFQNIEQAGWIFHNSAFDLFHLRRYIVVPQRKKLWDTQLVEQVRFSGKFQEFNLAACCRRNLDLLLEKEERESFENHSGEMTQSQVEYACKDPIATHQLFVSQRSQIDADDLKVWKEIELPYMWVVIGKSGMPVDVESWKNNAENNLRIAQDIQDKYGKQVNKISAKTGKPLKSLTWEGINLGSNPQVLAKLNSLGFGVESTGKKVLAELGGDEESDVELVVEGIEHEFLQDLVNFRKYKKRSSTYGQKWLDKYVEADNCVYPGIFQREAETSRSCVAGDTILETTSGCFAISELVLTGSEKCEILTHKGRYKPILRTIYKGKEEMFEVTLDNGSSIKCTMKHRFLTDNGWKMLKEITDGDRILTPETADTRKEEGTG